jgi:cytoskeletal protein RodZ
MINSINNEKNSKDNTSKYIIIALIVIAVVLAGVFAYIGFGNNESGDSQNQVQNSNPTVENVNNKTQSSEPAQTTTQSSSASSTPTSSMNILGGSFSTGGGLSDKTYASIYVGPEHSGENVKIQIKYSRDGSSLNNGNMVPKTVDSDGYINVKSADAYKYFPDYATINIYDNSGNLLDTQSVSLSPESGTQSF